ncbi:MAG: hypothetical protein FWD31_10115 [Planctomycetaceae bacterium]|nr:hypothetical protein [Planctomycetaceae bacterium]
MHDLKRSNKHKFSLSDKHQSFSDIKKIFEERKEALRHFCECDDVLYLIGFPKTFLSKHLQEAEYDACLALFGAIEAAFRIDLFVRHKNRGKDPRSKAVRLLLKELSRGDFDYKIRLDEIFRLLAKDTAVSDGTINSLVVYFKYRNWLAHGRYWILEKNLGMKKPPTFDEIFQLTEKIKSFFQKS